MPIIHGDSLIELKALPENSVDLVITSPPYNKNYWLRNRHQKGKRVITYEGFDDSLDPKDYIERID